MFSKKIYLVLVLFVLFSMPLMADTFGFKPDGSNYFKTVSEATDGTIQISVTDEGSAGFSLNFQLHVDYTSVVSTTNWKDNSSGNGYYKDWNPSGVSWTSTNTTTHPVTGGYLNASLITSGSAPYWQISLVATSAGDMTYTITLPVYDDKIYEGGSTGTAETINFKISNVLSGSLDSDKNAFSYKIQDNDKIPYYGFAQTSTQTFDEGHNTNDDGNGLSFAIIPIANPTDNVVYAVGTNSFVINWAISDGTTTSSDYSSASGSVTISEQIGGGQANESVINTGNYWNSREVAVTMVDDNVDEPDTETFTITLSTTDSDDGLIFGDNNDLSVVINDDPEDLAPYVRFTSASQYVDEESSNSTVTVSLELNAGSGFSDPSVAYTVSLSSTAEPSGTYQDHTLENGTVVFDGSVGDQNQDITFTLKADVFDEGLDNDNSVVETVIITLDGGNVSNLRVDNDAYANTTHTVNIRDNDPTPQLAFSSDGSVTAVSGAESVTSPTIKVLVTDGAGNLTPSALPITLNVTNHTSSAGTATIYSDATTPWDYKINGTTGSVTGVTIPAYSSEYAVPIVINSDAYYEGSDETVKFDITAGNNASGGTFTHTYTIGDDDAKPTIFFTNGASTITSTETGGSNITGTIDVQLSTVSAKAVDFTYSVTSYNAGSGDDAYLSNSIDDDGDGSTDESNEGDAANTDFDLPASTGSIAAVTNTTATSSSTQISYTHYVDKVDELDKYVELTVAVAVGESDATVASNGTQTQIIKLEDDDAAQQVSFSASSDESNDEGDTETITVLKLTDSTTPAQTNGTTSSEFTMKATIGVGSSANPATDGDTDDDFDLSTSGGTAIAAGASQVLTFGPSDASASISIAIDDDDLYEGGASGTAEDVKFELSSLVNAVAGGNPNMTYYIVDDENKPVISFDTDASNSVPSGNENTVSSPSITVIQDRRSIYPSTINYSANPSGGTASADDFTLEDGVAEIAALSTTTTIPLQIVSETKFEGNETVVIALDGSTVSGNTTPSGSNLSHTYTITNDDTKPTLEFSAVNKSGGSASASSPEEADGSVIITVSLSAITGVATNVSYTIASSTGASDADWSDGTTDYDSDASTNIITWAADESTISKTIVVNFTDDTIDEGDEIITVTLSGVSGGAQDGSTLLHTITLQDSDTPPIMQFTNSTASVNESDGNITIPLTLTHDGTNKQASDFGNAQMTWTINGLSTVTSNNSSTDYPNDITTATTGSIVINKGLTDGSIVISLNNDAIDEWDETLIVDLTSPVNATASGNQRITVTISDEDDASPTINFTSTALGSGTTETASANATINFTDHIRLTGKSGKDLWFSYTTEGGGAGTASPNQDYTPLTGTFKIVEDALAPSVTVPLVILADDVDELDEQTVKITISVLGADQNDDNSSYEQTSSAETAKNGNMVFTYTIDDDDDPPNAFFKNVDGDNDSEVGSIDESAGPKEIIVALSAGSERNITLYYSDASSGSATSRSDYSAITAFTPITINGAVGGTGATESTISIAITNDEIHEEDQTIVLSLLSTNASTSDMATISYASAGGGSGAEAINTYTITIVNDEDPPKVNFTNGSAVTDAETTIDEDAGSVILNVELNRATEKTVTIPYAFINDAVIPATGSTSTGAYPKDFYHTGFTDGGSLTISGDGTDVSQGTTITINLLADAVDEWDEKVILNIGTPTNAEVGTVVTHTVIITDQSAAPTINFTTTAEGSGTSETASAAATINFTDHISLSSKSGKDLWFSYATDGNPGTATSGQDYTPVSGSFKIAAGSTTPASSIALPILSDTVDELDEQTVKVTLDVLGADQNNDNSVYEATSNALSAIEGSMVYTYTIDDDDAPPFVYFKNLDSVTGSESGTVDEGETKTITVALSSPSERDVVIYRSDAGTGNASSGTDYTAITAFSKLTTISGTAGGIGADTEVTFDVISTEDLIHEVDQTIVINLLTTASVTGDMDVISYASAGGGTGAQAVSAYALTITDDEELPAVNFTDGSASALSTNTISEDAGTITVNVELSIATEKTVTIPFTFGSSSLPAATGADATGAYPIDFYHSGYSGGGSLTINGDGTDATPGASFVLNIQSDAIDEWDEKIEINLGDGPTNAQKGGTFQHIITITDASEAPTINFSSTSLDNGNTETNQASADFNLKDIIVLSSKSGKDITFSITTETDGNGATAAAPRDYTLINDTFTITAGNTAIADDLTLDILDDLYDETDKQTIVVDIAFVGADRDGDGSYDDPDSDPAAVNGSTRFTYAINDD
ncbi:hypothetical protein N9C41_01930, partial [Candidatus Marinimicrobia bacterium]|nr:hypothetical protein [Candidatus Neomarinimicrobiota bacterium]